MMTTIAPSMTIKKSVSFEKVVSEKESSCDMYKRLKHGGQCQTRRSFWNLSCDCLFSSFPDELLIISIFTYLDAIDLSFAASVCRRWRFISSDRMLWRRLSFAKTSKLTDAPVSSLIKRFGDVLSDLEFCECKRVTKSMLLEFAPTLKHLESLHLCQLKAVDDSVLAAFAENCASLESLSLFGCRSITDDGVIALQTWQSTLKQLSLGNCTNISDRGLTSVGGKALREISLRNCSKLTNEAIGEFVERSPNLEKLNLSSLKVDDDILTKIASACPNLSVLNFASSNPFGGGKITDVGLRAIARLGNKLISLNLQGSSKITDEGILYLVRRCPRLEQLNLGGCVRLTDKSLAALVHFCSKLTHLNLFQCSKITDVGILLLSLKLNKLIHLDLHSCHQLSNSVLQSFFNNEQFPNLEFLDIGSCSGISSEVIKNVVTKRPGLKITHY